MLFNSFIFLIFLGMVLPVFYLLPTKNWRNGFLLLASYVFYGYWDWRFCSLLLVSTLVDYFVGQQMAKTAEKGKRKGLLLISMLVNLGILGFFKYFNFFADSFANLLASFGGNADFVHLNIILPVGISFYTFQTMTYTIDIYRKRLEPTRSLPDFALYVAFFPQLVAGPIERATNLLPQLSKKYGATRAQFEKGMVLVAMGMFKKVMIGDTAGRIVDRIFAQPELYHSPELIMGLVLFAIQIYADFSGYSSIARGVAKLLGIELMKNFEQPYLSANITEFWRRWHISLSSWLRDYLYISLGGNRKGEGRTYVNLMLTMLLGGLWHGASWNFVIWGGLHGIYLAVHKWMLGGNKVKERYTYQGYKSLAGFLGGVLFTNLLVLFTWLFFRARTFTEALQFLHGIFDWQPSEFTPRILTILLSFILAMLAFDVPQYITKKHTYFLLIKNTGLRWGILAALFVTSLIYMFQAEPMPFVYFQF